MSNAAFWVMDGAIGLVGAFLIFVLRKPLSRVLEPRPA
jgi:hypothetical protein